MKILHNAVLVVFTAAFLLATSSCEKENAKQEGPDVFFSIAVDNLVVVFENKTTGADTYEWDFGDGTTSTEESPTHTYAEKGKYVPTLYATASNGQKTEASTVVRIAKPSSVRLDDNSLNDWDTVTHNVIIAGPAGGIFRKAKFDYNGNDVYFYFEMASAKANGDIFDFYMDSDNNSGTGFITGLFKESGNDVLIEGAMLNDWFDMLYHSGATQDAWGWTAPSVTDFYEVGTTQESGGILKFEGKLVRSKIKGLTGKGMKIGVAVSNSGWSQIGTIPDPNTPSFFLDMSE